MAEVVKLKFQVIRNEAFFIDLRKVKKKLNGAKSLLLWTQLLQCDGERKCFVPPLNSDSLTHPVELLVNMLSILNIPIFK